MNQLSVDSSGPIERLWWLQGGCLNGLTSADVEAAPTRIELPDKPTGVAAGHGRVACWRRTSLWVLDAATGDVVHHLTLEGSAFLVATLVEGGLDFGATETTGHPTDRMSSRTLWRFERPWVEREPLADGQGVPPMGFRGRFPWQRTVDWSGPEGYVETHHRVDPYKTYWKAHDKRRVRIKKTNRQYAIQGFGYGGDLYFATREGAHLVVFSTVNGGQVFRWKAPAYPRGAVAFDGDLFVLCDGLVPQRVRAFAETVSESAGRSRR